MAVTSPGPTAPPPGAWAPASLATVRTDTWQRALAKLHGRTQATLAVPGSAGQRALQWNTYMASVLPYPSQVALPTPADRRSMDALFASLFPTAGWAPGWTHRLDPPLRPLD